MKILKKVCKYILVCQKLLRYWVSLASFSPACLISWGAVISMAATTETVLHAAGNATSKISPRSVGNRWAGDGEIGFTLHARHINQKYPFIQFKS